MRRALLLLATALPAYVGAQDLVVDGTHRSADVIRAALAKPHIVRSGSGKLELPRDSTISTTLIVVGRPTYLASKVNGDVVVIGSDLFLRPGADISGRAVAIGGTVSLTTLGHVQGGTESFRDETYMSSVANGTTTLTYQRVSLVDPVPLLQPAGIQGLLIPSYDRVDGLSLPIGALITVSGVEIEPRLTYRSRLGVVDPGVEVRTSSDRDVRFEGRAGRDTRSNDKWIYSDLVNSLTTFWNGSDTRNYYRSSVGEGRVFFHIARPGMVLEPFVGGRYERASSISGTGDIFTVRSRTDTEHTKRPNPAVEPGDISSLLAGAMFNDTAGVVISRARLELEGSASTMAGTSQFVQLTFDGRVAFPTFGTQKLRFRGHGVATTGDAVPRARYAYIGGSGTLPVADLMEFGGGQLAYLESLYLIPVDAVILPVVGSPVVTVRHIIGGAGIKSLPKLEQTIGAGLGLSVLHFDVDTDVARSRGTKFSFGISLGS
ncbi:MAG: hypothetical protein JWM95_3976 [Gemmatimonadetes bacterium]|nr:hypothetical protein [Gemmatimonadota bacterium]